MSRPAALIAAGIAVAALLAAAAPACAAEPACETRKLENKADLSDVATRLTTGSKLLAGTGAVALLIGEAAGGKLVKVVGSAEVALAGIMDILAIYYPPGTTVTACPSSQGGPAVIGLHPDTVALAARLGDSDPQRAGGAGTAPKSDLAAAIAMLNKQPAGALAPGAPGAQWHFADIALIGTSVSGVVKDARTGSPLPRATVRLSGPVISQETVTDADGSYRFAAVLAGDYTIAVENAGYVPQKQPIAIAGGESAITDNFAVTPVYPCDFAVHNETGGRLAFWYDESDGPHLAAIIEPDRTVTVRGMTHALQVSAESLAPRLRWHGITIACGGRDQVHFGPPQTGR